MKKLDRTQEHEVRKCEWLKNKNKIKIKIKKCQKKKIKNFKTVLLK